MDISKLNLMKVAQKFDTEVSSDPGKGMVYKPRLPEFQISIKKIEFKPIIVFGKFQGIL
jgi:hypothetical protein